MLIQVSSGQGPKECERACYLYYKELLKEIPSLEVVSINEQKDRCIKSVILYSTEDLSYLEGSVQWICQSPFRLHHKRKNWFIDVSILQERFRFDKIDDIKFEVYRSSGKGGQNVNKVSTAIRAIHIPTGISAVSMDQRSQLQNKKIAYIRLIEKINQMNKKVNQKIQYDNWNEKNLLIRGNPVRVYKGEKMKRVR